MTNKIFSRLTDSERSAKFAAVIRSRTANLLNAGQIQSLAENIYLNRQYNIAVHKSNRERCEAFADNGTLHIYIPEHFITNESEETHKL